MRVITVLNRCTEFKRFVIEGSRLDGRSRIVVSLRGKTPRQSAAAAVSCRPPMTRPPNPGGSSSFRSFHRRMRRVDCKACGRVIVEKVPWSTGKHHLTDIYRCFLGGGRRSCRQVALSDRGISLPDAPRGRLRSIESPMGEKRTKKSLDNGFTELEQEHLRQEVAGVKEPPFPGRHWSHLLWKAYLTHPRPAPRGGPHSQHFSKALDKVRAEEARRLKQEGQDPVLSSRRLSQSSKPLQRDYTYPAWAEQFLHRWCFRTMRSKIEPMKDIAKMLRRHQGLILNWFRAKKQFNNGIVEGLNLKWNLTVRKAFGFRTFNALQIASFHQLGDLPEPQFTHEFY